MTDEVAEVDAGHKRIAISAGKRSRAMLAKIGLQPFKDFLLRFHRFLAFALSTDCQPAMGLGDGCEYEGRLHNEVGSNQLSP